MAAVSLQTEDLTIRFGGHVAVDHVSCAFRPGELTVIVGPNGAGKTTYFNLISGQLPASAGRILKEGRDITGLSTSARARAGIGRAFQLTNLFPLLTVLENIRLVVQARQNAGLNIFRSAASLHAIRQEAERHLESARLTHVAHAPASILPAWRPAQAGGRHADRDAAGHLHVRRTDRRHEPRRGAGDP